MANLPKAVAMLNQTKADSGLPARVTLPGTWVYMEAFDSWGNFKTRDPAKLFNIRPLA